MTQNGREQQDVPSDLALKEAFEAFIHQTQVPEDFHAGVMERVQHQRARRGRWGGWESFGTWWTQAWSPLGVCTATVCGLLSLALNIGLGYYAWQRMQAVTRLGQELTAAQAQVREVQAERHQWQTRQAALTDQLAALQAQAQREAQDNAALRDQVAAAQEQVRQTQAENHEWQARSADLTRQLGALQAQVQPEAPSARGTILGLAPKSVSSPMVPGTDLRGRPYTTAELAQALFPEDRGWRFRSSMPKAPVVLPLPFAPASAAIEPQYFLDLDRLATVLTQPQYAASRVQITGHTDSLEAPGTETALAHQRAEAVQRYLVAHFPLASEQLLVHGEGASHPRATNDTPEGRSANRRVEIVAME